MLYWIEDLKPKHHRGIIQSSYLDSAIKNGFIGIGISYEKQTDLENIVSLIKNDKNATVLVTGSIAFTKAAIDNKEPMFDLMKSMSLNYHNVDWVYYDNLKEHFVAPKTIMTFEEFKNTHRGTFFIKSLDHKKFTGIVYNTEEDFVGAYWHKFKKYPVVDNNSIVMISPVRNIDQEYRFIILDGKIITWGQYRGENKIITDQQYNVIEQIAVKAEKYDRIFSLDIGIVDNIPHIVEINPFWSSGVYPEMDTYMITSKLHDLISIKK